MKRDGRECAICGERNHSTSGHEPVERGGRESGESGSVAEGTGRDRIAAANPAAHDPALDGHTMSGWSREDFIRRIRDLEAELDRNEGECYGPFHAGFLCEACRVRFDELCVRAEKAEAEIERLKAHCCVKTREGKYWARQYEDDCHVGRDCGV